MIPTKASESLTLFVLWAQIYSHSRRPKMAIGFGDLGIGCKSTAFFAKALAHLHGCPLWQLCVGDLRVCRFQSRFANLRATAPPIVWRRLSG